MRRHGEGHSRPAALAGLSPAFHCLVGDDDLRIPVGVLDRHLGANTCGAFMILRCQRDAVLTFGKQGRKVIALRSTPAILLCHLADLLAVDEQGVLVVYRNKQRCGLRFCARWNCQMTAEETVA